MCVCCSSTIPWKLNHKEEMRDQIKSISKASLCRWGQFQILQQCRCCYFQHQPKPNFSSVANNSGWVGSSGVGTALLLSPSWDTPAQQPLPMSLHQPWASSPSTAQRCSPPPTGTSKNSQAKSLSLELTAKGHWVPRRWKRPLLRLLALQLLPVGSTGPLAAEAGWYTKLS